MAWLRGTTWFQRIALFLLLAAAGNWIFVKVTGGDPPTGTLVLALFITFLSYRKKLLWRVRNRLILTYILFGVIPLLLIFWLLQLITLMLLGQFASERVRHDLEARMESLHAVAQD